MESASQYVFEPYLETSKSYPYELVTLKLPTKKLESITSKIERLFEEERFVQEKEQKYLALTNREKQLLSLLAQGYNNPKIAHELNISRKTVEQHRKKLDIHSIQEAIRFAQAFNLV